jgi:hypothetical protein
LEPVVAELGAITTRMAERIAELVRTEADCGFAELERRSAN